MNRKKATTKRENKRIDHKKARAAERQALDGGYSRMIHGLSWSHTPEQPPLLDEAMPPRPRKKDKRKWCKGQVGKEHQWEAATKYYGSTPYAITRCKRCRKEKWGRNDYVVTPVDITGTRSHWSYLNISRRLAGKYCACDKCDAEVRALFE